MRFALPLVPSLLALVVHASEVPVTVLQGATPVPGTLVLADETGVRSLPIAPAVFYPAGVPQVAAYAQVVTDQILVRLTPGGDAAAFSAAHGLRVVRSDLGIPDTFLAQVVDPAPGASLGVAGALAALPSVVYAIPQLADQAAPLALSAGPASLTLNAGSDRVSATWSVVSGAESYVVYVGTATKVYTQRITGIGATSGAASVTLSVPGFAIGTTVFVVVTAVVSGTEGLPSGEASITLGGAFAAADAAAPLAGRTVPNDPLFPYQWHLVNLGASSDPVTQLYVPSNAVAGEDLGIYAADKSNAWDRFAGGPKVVGGKGAWRYVSGDGTALPGSARAWGDGTRPWGAAGTYTTGATWQNASPYLNRFRWDPTAPAVRLRGYGANVQVVDVGCQLGHPDLKDNARADLSYDLNAMDSDPSPESGEDHSTFVSGLAMARGNNGIGVTGIAPEGGLIALRWLGRAHTDADSAIGQWLHSTANADNANSGLIKDTASAANAQKDPLNWAWVSNNSWGVYDSTGVLLPLNGPLFDAALKQAATEGRGGRGVILVYSSGNDGAVDATVFNYVETQVQNGNYGKNGKSRYMAMIGAMASDGYKTSYSNTGSNLLCTAPTGEDGKGGSVSTDRTGTDGYGAGDYTGAAGDLAGTSFSGPLVAGYMTVLVQANPELTWRDAQAITAVTARRNRLSDDAKYEVNKLLENPAYSLAAPLNYNNPLGWQTNGAGVTYSEKHGFGCVNLANATAAIDTWAYLPVESRILVSTKAVPAGEDADDAAAFANQNVAAAPIADFVSVAGTGSSSLTVAPAGAQAGFRVEAVEFTVDITHARRGDLELRLVSPAGTEAIISRRKNDTAANLTNLTFLARNFFGEDPTGTWSLVVYDRVNGSVGTINSWRMKLFGHVPYSRPTVTSAAVQAAETNGDTRIVISGSGFSSNASGRASAHKVTLGGAEIPEVITDGSTLVAVVPAGFATRSGVLVVKTPIEGANGVPTWTGAFADTVPGGSRSVPVATVPVPPVTPAPPTYVPPVDTAPAATADSGSDSKCGMGSSTAILVGSLSFLLLVVRRRR